ncbi:MAG: hypothetical protein SFV54_28035 [Bryobacteraceae bacterium]|nr:hypothetical protein [Bryobacteraceae bacterium]
MDLFGALEIRIFLALAVVLGVAFVALVCDVLKRSNEQLRDVNTELRVRLEERQRMQAETRETAPVERVAPPRPAGHTPRRERDRRPARTQRQGAPEQAPETTATSVEPASSLVPAPAEMPDPGILQAGIHDRSTLDSLLESNAPLHGIALALGVNESCSPPQAELSRIVRQLLHAEDIAFRYSEAEFILILHGEGGAAGQRRLKQIAECLWDYQFRSVGLYSILFTWGAAESRGESVAVAVAKAREDMEQTRRSRKPVPIDARRRRGA